MAEDLRKLPSRMVREEMLDEVDADVQCVQPTYSASSLIRLSPPDEDVNVQAGPSGQARTSSAAAPPRNQPRVVMMNGVDSSDTLLAGKRRTSEQQDSPTTAATAKSSRGAARRGSSSVKTEDEDEDEDDEVEQAGPDGEGWATAEGVVHEAEGLQLHLSARSATGYRGVRFHSTNRSNPLRARAQGGACPVDLGNFATASEAAVCYARHVQQQEAMEDMTHEPLQPKTWYLKVAVKLWQGREEVAMEDLGNEAEPTGGSRPVTWAQCETGRGPTNVHSTSQTFAGQQPQPLPSVTTTLPPPPPPPEGAVVKPEGAPPAWPEGAWVKPEEAPPAWPEGAWVKPEVKPEEEEEERRTGTRPPPPLPPPAAVVWSLAHAFHCNDPACQLNNCGTNKQARSSAPPIRPALHSLPMAHPTRLHSPYSAGVEALGGACAALPNAPRAAASTTGPAAWMQDVQVLAGVTAGE